MAASSQLVGHTLGHYGIIKQIGAGGMGVDYLARDEQLERDVAVKALPIGTLADEAARKRGGQGWRCCCVCAVRKPDSR